MSNRMCEKEKRGDRGFLVNNSFIILVLFILLVIILGAAFAY